MVHFNGKTTYLMDMQKQEKKAFLKNVDLTKTDFEVKIADFGLSKKLSAKEIKCLQYCGTLLYMAPQVVFKNKYTYKCDIWSLGVILYTMFNKTTPFQA